jgi:tetratricopeptide (TPR) repeat protein
MIEKRDEAFYPYMDMAEIKYNLNYRFGADLREVPEDSVSMLCYVEFMMNEAKKMQKVIPLQNPRALVKFLGEAGSYYRILGKNEPAQCALEECLKLIDAHQLGISYWAVNTIRLGEVLRAQKDFLGAETAFKAVLEMAERNQDVMVMKDFSLQHLGKLYYDQKNFSQARICFQEALEIREKKGDKALIESTQFALRNLNMRVKSKY